MVEQTKGDTLGGAADTAEASCINKFCSKLSSSSNVLRSSRRWSCTRRNKNFNRQMQRQGSFWFANVSTEQMFQV